MLSIIVNDNKKPLLFTLLKKYQLIFKEYFFATFLIYL
jgi:hypothetical protein